MITNHHHYPQSTHFSETPKSPSGVGIQSYKGNHKYDENGKHYNNGNSLIQGKSPATYDSNTLK